MRIAAYFDGGGVPVRSMHRHPHSGGGLVANRFDIVTVWIQHERAVVVRVVMQPWARSAVVACTGGQRGRMECIDAAMIGCSERDMRASGP